MLDLMLIFLFRISERCNTHDLTVGSPYSRPLVVGKSKWPQFVNLTATFSIIISYCGWCLFRLGGNNPDRNAGLLVVPFVAFTLDLEDCEGFTNRLSL